MGISIKMVMQMMADAGMTDDAIMAAVPALAPIARYNGSPYYCPTKVSRYIKRAGY